MSSPASSPKSPHHQHRGGLPQQQQQSGGKTRRISAPPIPDISQLSPPSVQYTPAPTGATPPMSTGLPHRRRTSSSSSCGTPPPTAYTPSASPIRRSVSQGTKPFPTKFQQFYCKLLSTYAKLKIFSFSTVFQPFDARLNRFYAKLQLFYAKHR